MDRTEKLFMPLWQPFTGIRAETMIGSLSDEEERTVALAAHHYFQAKYEDAARESQHGLNSPCPESRATALTEQQLTDVLTKAVSATEELEMELDFTSPG